MAPPKVALLVLALCVAFPAIAGAQQRPDPSALSEAERDELGKLFSRAQTAYEAENYLEAIEALKAAHAIFPEPNILYRIGEAHEQLGDLSGAADYYTRYVEAAPNAKDAGLVRRRVTDLERRAADLEKQLQTAEPERAALLLDTNPTGATVLLDGNTVEKKTPVRVEVAPGTHRIELKLEGHEKVSREVEIDASETISLVYQLERIATPPPPKRSKVPLVLTIAGGTAIAAGGGFLIASAVAGNKVAKWDAARFEQYDAGVDVDERPDEYNSTVERQYTFRTTGIITGAVGGAALVAGIVWMLTQGGEEEIAIRPTATGFAFDF